MLSSLRSASQTLVAKILFGLLTLTFVGWGVGDMLRMRIDNPPAITVGDVKIMPQEVVESFRRDVQILQQRTGGKFTIEQARQAGLLNQTVQHLVSDSLLDQEAAQLGLAVDDGTLRRTVASIPAFHNQSNAFDPQIYRDTLAASGFTEARFLDMQRRDIVREEMGQIVGLGTSVPDALLDPIFDYRYQKRTVELIAFQASAMPAPATPDEAAQRAFYKDHTADFTAPETRGITGIVIRAADLVKGFAPTDAQIAKAYQDRQADFAQDETRHLRQAFFSDKDSAQKLVDAVKAGTSFADAAKAAGKSVDDLGQVDRKSLPIDAIADATFSSPVPGVAGPVQTPLGWNVFEVTDKKAAGTKPLAEVRDQIVADLVKEEGSNRLNALSTKIEDAIGSGASLDEVANTANAKPIKIPAVDAAGNGPDGKPVPGLPGGTAFVDTAFKTAKGETSEVTPLDKEEGYFVVHVDDIVPASAKPFEQVKDGVIAAMAVDARRDEARKAAEAAVQRLNKGESTQAVAGALKIETPPPFTRAGDEKTPATVAAAAFNLAVGAAAAVPTGDTAYAVRLTAVLPADPKANGIDRDALRDQLTQSIDGDLSQQYLNALQRQYGVKIQPAVIDQQFAQSQ